jgi:hypothetical protein
MNAHDLDTGIDRFGPAFQAEDLASSLSYQLRNQKAPPPAVTSSDADWIQRASMSCLPEGV